jgi:hypothetical protein
LVEVGFMLRPNPVVAWAVRVIFKPLKIGAH